MDDLSSKLSSILSDPSAMQEIAALASSLGVDPSGVHSEPPPRREERPPDSASALSMMSGLMPLMGALRQEDDTTRLLDALRPFLSGERLEKLDRAKKLIGMMRLMPMLRELNLFDL